jgi:hypothetical protein
MPYGKKAAERDPGAELPPSLRQKQRANQPAAARAGPGP